MFSEDEYLPMSLLADMLFCERRAALHILEGIWKDNVFTVEGTILHQKVDAVEATEVRGNTRICRGLPLRCSKLGLSGRADLVEFHRVADDNAGGFQYIGEPLKLKGVEGLWTAFPVDYKRGRLRHEAGFEAQLCAQAMGLEEMLGGSVIKGFIYYAKPHRRMEVDFDDKLRRDTLDAALRLHLLFKAGATPKPRYEKKCEACSLFSLCMPRVIGGKKSVVAYMAANMAAVNEAEHEEAPEYAIRHHPGRLPSS